MVFIHVPDQFPRWCNYWPISCQQRARIQTASKHLKHSKHSWQGPKRWKILTEICPFLQISETESAFCCALSGYIPAIPVSLVVNYVIGSFHHNASNDSPMPPMTLLTLSVVNQQARQAHLMIRFVMDFLYFLTNGRREWLCLSQKQEAMIRWTTPKKLIRCYSYDYDRACWSSKSWLMELEPKVPFSDSGHEWFCLIRSGRN